MYFCFYLLSIQSKTVTVKRTVNRILHHCPFLHTGLHHGQKEAVEICSVLDVQCGDWPESQTICEPEGDDMHLREQTTSFQVRLEMMEQASAGLNDTQIATALDCSLWTVRRVATKITQAWSYRLSLPDGTSCHWPGEHLSQGMKGGPPSFAQAPSRLGTGHAFSHTQDGCILVRSAASESCTHRQAPQTSRLDAPRSPSSRPDPTTSNPTHFSAPEMANGRGIRIMRVDGVGKVSLISIVDAVSRLKAESYPSLETTNPALSDYQLSDAPERSSRMVCRRH